MNLYLAIALWTAGLAVAVRILFWIAEMVSGPPKFKDKVVWVTGASSGIGEQFSYAFSEAGATLILSARKEDKLQKVKESCRYPEKVIIYPMDMSDPFETEKAVRKFLDENPNLEIDVLVNNAGMGNLMPVLDDTSNNDIKIFNLNVLSQMAITRLVGEKMKKRKQGQIAIISSIAGKLGIPYQASYCASKHAMIGYFDSLRAELQSENIYVTTICPGFINTNFRRNVIVGGSGERSGKSDENFDKGLLPETVARKAVNAIYRKKKEVIIPDKYMEIAFITLRAIMPDFAFLVNRTMMKKKLEISCKKED